MNYILSQIERQDGVQSGQEQEMIRVLWNKREVAYKQLRDTELQLKELRLEDNNIVDGLKVGQSRGRRGEGRGGEGSTESHGVTRERNLD